MIVPLAVSRWILTARMAEVECHVLRLLQRLTYDSAQRCIRAAEDIALHVQCGCDERVEESSHRRDAS